MTQEVQTDGASRNGSEAPGDVLLAAHEMWVSGQTSPAAHDEAARSLGIPSSAFEAIREFHRRVIARAKDEPLILCRGVSCRLHGADEFHLALKAGLEAAGAQGPTLDVLCLSQCPHGPNLKLGSQVLCTGRGNVITDERPWRPPTAGPKPVV
jgi:NADH:ubiquinone oxidoreductase subunit E